MSSKLTIASLLSERGFMPSTMKPRLVSSLGRVHRGQTDSDEGRARDKANYGSGRALIVLKAALVDAELGRLDLNLRMQRDTSSMVSTMDYAAGGAAGGSLAVNLGIRAT
jgi:hypothetical protein